jgi:predicted NAD-dependent protein-ADP-ribosyltransferase YbiA (DUF1768 family)
MRKLKSSLERRRALWVQNLKVSAIRIKPMSEQDVRNMKLVLSLKLEQHIFIRDSLLETNDQLIFEDVSNRRGARHLFWGMKMENGAWLGQNVLGKLWMELREEYLTNS